LSQNDQIYFDGLKKKVVAMMQESYPGINPSISEWKGQEITDFQEELRSRVNAQISEKWFYTHMKASGPTLPRVDVLNFLSRYAGYANWDDFKFRNNIEPVSISPAKKANRIFIIVPVLVLAILVLLVIFYKLFQTREYKFCFYDADTRDPVTNSVIEVTLLKEHESPVNILCSNNGCFTLKTETTHLKFIVQSPYYQTDTIIRVLDKFNRNEQIKLHANNYALMIHYFSNMDVKDWQKRRMQLDRMIDDAAVIYQVFEHEAVGMELYNKAEFINLLTMPSARMKNIEVLDSRVKGEKIALLRFRINKKR
jgi:hypothetical protein